MPVATGSPAPPHLLDADGGEVCETHISWVFLTGDRAYKVKKPIVLPFLDYSTPERRHALCRAELELNRRTAPDLYLAVRSLVPAGAGLRLADEDDPEAVDFAVEMRRYDESSTFEARLRHGAVGLPEVAAVGARVASFHATAPVVTGGGGAEAVKRALDDDFASLRRLAPDGAVVARLERSAGAFLTAAWAALDARAAAGLVRDGHGDLRLEHILLGARVEIVDCVEFEPDLRRIDTAADLAFAIMELHERGRPDLAVALAGAYRAAGGDPGSDALLSFFAAYRAEVRAKVALLRAGQRPPAAARADRQHAERLLALATRLRWQAHAPLVIAIAGVSATGKSTVARHLASASGFTTLNSDVVRKTSAGLAPTTRGPASLYTRAASRSTYAELGRRAARRMAAGVVVDATFRCRADRDAFRAALGPAARTLWVELVAPAAELERRAAARTADPQRVSDAGVEVVRAQLHGAERLDEVPADEHLILRADRAPPRIVDAISDALDARARYP